MGSRLKARPLTRREKGSANPRNCTPKAEDIKRMVKTPYFRNLRSGSLFSRGFMNRSERSIEVPKGQTQEQNTRPKTRVRAMMMKAGQSRDTKVFMARVTTARTRVSSLKKRLT